MGFDQIAQIFFAILIGLVAFNYLELTSAIILFIGGIVMQSFADFGPAY
ncbi:MAG: hypothetical protein V1811_03110 [Candidatus Micrarchaeota archaeon]